MILLIYNYIAPRYIVVLCKWNKWHNLNVQNDDNKLLEIKCKIKNAWLNKNAWKRYKKIKIKRMGGVSSYIGGARIIRKANWAHREVGVRWAL